MYGIHELEIIRQYTEQLKEAEKNYQHSIRSPSGDPLGNPWSKLKSFFRPQRNATEQVEMQCADIISSDGVVAKVSQQLANPVKIAS